MKHMLIILVLLVIFAMLCANPLTVYNSLVSEIWFSANGHLNIEFAPRTFWPGESLNLNEVLISNGQIERQIPYNHMMHDMDPPFVLDVTNLIPDLIFNPAGDTLLLRQFYEGEYVIWNEMSWGNDLSNDINPPLTGQSLVLNMYHELSYGWFAYWCKDATPSPGQSPYCPLSYATINVYVRDQDNNPVPNAIVNYASCSGYLNPIGLTNSSGEATINLSAKNYRIVVEQPLNYLIIYNQNHWLEPNDTTTINIIMNNSDNSDDIIPIVYNGLQAYPTPFNLNTADAITFKYDGDAKLSKDTYIRLYDTKGRFILQIPMNAKGMATWKPTSETRSGHYLARLISGNRIVDMTTITIIK